MRKISMYLLSVIAICLFVLGFKPVDAKAATDYPKVTSVTINKTTIKPSDQGSLTFHVVADGTIKLKGISIAYIRNGSTSANNYNRFGVTYDTDNYFSDVLSTGDYTVPMPYNQSYSGEYSIWYIHLMYSNEWNYGGGHMYITDTESLTLDGGSGNTCTVSSYFNFEREDGLSVYGYAPQKKDGVVYQNILNDINAMSAGSVYLIDTQAVGYDFIYALPGDYLRAIKGQNKNLCFLGYDFNWTINGMDINGTVPNYFGTNGYFDWEASKDACVPVGGYYDYIAYEGDPYLFDKIHMQFKYSDNYSSSDTLYLYRYNTIKDHDTNLVSLGTVKTFGGFLSERWADVTIEHSNSYYISKASNLQLKYIAPLPTTPTETTTETTGNSGTSNSTPSTETAPVITPNPPSITITQDPTPTSTERDLVGDIFVSGKLNYRVTDATSVCLYATEGVRGNVAIPSTVTYSGKSFNVTSIGYNAFSKTKVTTVVIPDTVTLIDKGAFSWTSKLKTVILGSNVQVIKSQAFYRSRLTTIKFTSAGVPNVSKSAFSYSTSGKVKVYKGQIKSSVMKKLLKKVKIKSYKLK